MGCGGPVLAPLLLALAYALLGAGSFLLLRGTGWAAPVWPAAGLAFAAVQACGARMVPGVLLGSLLLNLAIYGAVGLGAVKVLALSLTVAAAVALQAQAGAWGVRRTLGRRPALERGAEILPYMFIGGPAACLIASSTGTLAMLAAGLLHPVQVGPAWLTWWVGDIVGVFVFAPLTLFLLPSQTHLWRGRRLAVALPSLAMLALSLALFLLAAQGERRLWDLRLQGRGNLALVVLRRTLVAQQEVLMTFASMVEISGPPTPERFQRFTAGSLARHPELLALSWNPLLAGKDLAAFERRWRQHPGLEAYRVTERGPDGALVPVRPRSRHVPVAAIEPLAANRSALGFDIASDPSRAVALDRALATGHIQASPPIRLVQESGSQQGVLLLLPVRSPPGFAVGVVRWGDLLASTFAEGDWQTFRIRLFDRTPGDPVRELARLDPEPTATSASPLLPPQVTVVRRSFASAGRLWEVQLEPTSRFLLEAGPRRSPSLLLGSMLISGLMEGVLLLTTGSERRIQRRLEQTLRSSLTAAAVAHEIKQPLSSMLLQARLLQAALRREGEAAGQRSELLAVAEGVSRDARAVSRTIDRIRDLFGNVTSHRESLDIADPIRSALLVARAELALQGITLLCEGFEPPHRIQADREQLQLVMLNLIRNAVEATGRGGTVAITVRPCATGVEVEVADDGPGFDPAISAIEELELASRKPGGTGIGLYLVRCAMENHRGHVRLGRSALGGASVVLEFP